MPDEHVLWLSAEDFNRPVNDRFGYARHPVLEGQVGKLSRLDCCGFDVWAGSSKSVRQADRLGTERSRRCNKDLDIHRSVERSNRRQALLTQAELASPD